MSPPSRKAARRGGTTRHVRSGACLVRYMVGGGCGVGTCGRDSLNDVTRWYECCLTPGRAGSTARSGPPHAGHLVARLLREASRRHFGGGCARAAI